MYALYNKSDVWNNKYVVRFVTLIFDTTGTICTQLLWSLCIVRIYLHRVSHLESTMWTS